MMKFAAAILTVLALAGTAWAVMVVTRPIPGRMPVPGEAAELNQHLKTCDSELLHLRGLEGTLEQVDRLKDATQAQKTILAVYDSKSLASALASSNPEQEETPVISLIYISTDMKKVVINGVLLGVGDKMPDGGRLVSIAQDRIKYELNGKSKELLVPVPNVLGMAPTAKNEN